MLSVRDRRVNSRNYGYPRSLLRALAPLVRTVANSGIVPAGKAMVNFSPPKYSGSNRKRSASKISKPVGKVTIAAMGGNGKTVYKKKYKAKYKRKFKSFKAKVKKRLASLEKRSANYAEHIHKSNATIQPSCLTNEYGFAEGNLVSPAAIEAMLDSLPVLNTSTPATQLRPDFTLITVPAKYRISLYTKAIMRNNYLYPCTMDCYVLQPKANTSTTPPLSVTQGLTLMGGGGGTTITSTAAYMFYPTLSKEFRDTWDILKHHTQVLNSGDQMEMYYSCNLNYDHRYVDRNTQTYLHKFTRVCLIRVRGCLAHESSAPGNIGFSTAKLDCVIERTIKIKYPNASATRTLEDSKGVVDLTTAVVGVASAEVETAL